VDLDTQLQNLRSGKSKKIRGVTVRRNDNEYSVGDYEGLSLEDAKARLLEREDAPKTSSGLPYQRLVFIEKMNGRVMRTHRIKNRAEHLKLIETVMRREHGLCYADVVERNGKFYASHIHIIDWETVPDAEVVKTPTTYSPETWSGGLSCPFCGKRCSSTSGRTLHVKKEHEARFEEYRELVDEREADKRAKVVADNDVPVPDFVKKKQPVSDDDEEEDVVTHIRESNDPTKYPCPFCDACPTSSPGRTLHVKSKHPDRLKEYVRMMNG
jgi:hypothetical protein